MPGNARGNGLRADELPLPAQKLESSLHLFVTPLNHTLAGAADRMGRLNTNPAKAASYHDRKGALEKAVACRRYPKKS
jgi:hypothetical protein